MENDLFFRRPFWIFFIKKKKKLHHLNVNKQPVHMRYHLFLHYEWFFRILEKTSSKLICTRLYIQCCKMQNSVAVKKNEIQKLDGKHSACQKYEEDFLNPMWSSGNLWTLPLVAVKTNKCPNYYISKQIQKKY